MPIMANAVDPPGAAVLLSTNTSTNFVKGECTGHAGAAGQPNDTILVGIIILKNAGPATCLVAGFNNDTGAAASFTLSGLTTGDVYTPIGSVNNGGSLVLTPSVASTVIAVVAPSPGG